MTPPKRAITRDDLLSPEEFAAVRDGKYAEIREIKRHRRVAVGPFAGFYFENFATMWWQVQEMLRVEGGGEAQIEDELAAYNPLVPNGRELVATLMLEIAEPVRRDRELARLGGVEDAITLIVAGEASPAEPEREVERTTKAGKTSSVHFLHFPLSAGQAAALQQAGAEVQLKIDHPAYRHAAILPEESRAALAADLD